MLFFARMTEEKSQQQVDASAPCIAYCVGRSGICVPLPVPRPLVMQLGYQLPGARNISSCVFLQ